MIGRVGNKASLMKSKVETALEPWERGRAPPPPEPPDDVPLTPFYPLLPTSFFVESIAFNSCFKIFNFIAPQF